MQILFNNVKTDLSKLSMEKIEIKSAKIIVTHFTVKLLMKTPKLTKLLFSKFPQLIMIYDFFLKTPSSLFYLYNVYVGASHFLIETL